MSACRICRCTDDDCRGCIARTGAPCCWIEADLCSACSPGVELRRHLDEMVSRGEATQTEADEAYTFFDELSDRELRGEITPTEAMQQIQRFGERHLARRTAS
jgi:hypothetical protein